MRCDWSSWRVVLCVLWSGVGGAAHAASQDPPQRAGLFDFDYLVSGAESARPVQVFDDGVGKTYFQFRSGHRVPLILAGRDLQMVLPSSEGPYHTVAGRAGRFTLVLGKSRAVVRHASGDDAAHAAPVLDPSQAESRQALQPPSDRTSSSYATPTRGDVIEWVEPVQRHEHPVEFVGRSSKLQPATRAIIKSLALKFAANTTVQIESGGGPETSERTRSRIDTVRAELTAAGVDQQRVSVSRSARSGAAGSNIVADTVRIRWHGALRLPGARPEVPVSAPTPIQRGRPVPGNFDILASDGTLAASLLRWAKHSGHQFSWDAPIQAPITGEVTLVAGSFPEAAAKVVRGLQDSGYPVQLQQDGSSAFRVSRRVPSPEP